MNDSFWIYKLSGALFHLSHTTHSYCLIESQRFSLYAIFLWQIIICAMPRMCQTYGKEKLGITKIAIFFGSLLLAVLFVFVGLCILIENFFTHVTRASLFIYFKETCVNCTRAYHYSHRFEWKSIIYHTSHRYTIHFLWFFF